MLAATGVITPTILSAHFDPSRQAISKHLKVLIECDLLTYEKIGRESFYHINRDRIQEVDAWLQKFKSTMDIRFNQLDQLLTQINTPQ